LNTIWRTASAFALAAAIATATIGPAIASVTFLALVDPYSSASDPTVGYTGATLDTATSFTLGSGPFPGSIFLPLSDTGSFSISPTTIPTLGLDVPNSIDITKTFTGSGGETVTELLTEAYVTERVPFSGGVNGGSADLDLLLEGTITASSISGLTGQAVSFTIDTTFIRSGTSGSTFWFGTENSPVVPEPSTWAMMLLGFAGLGFAGYRQRHKLGGAAIV
jgi:hypothetical protein